MQNKTKQLLNRVFNEDVLDFLKQIENNSVDLIVTDPPYNSSTISWDKKSNKWQLSWMEEAKRILKTGGSFYCFFAPLNMFSVVNWFSKNLSLKNVIVWYHPNLYGAGTMFGKERYKSTWDVILYGTKGPKSNCKKKVAEFSYVQYRSGFDVMNYAQPRPLLHKGQKPLQLIKRLIDCSSEEGDIVVDPFSGSGTTAIASKMLKRNYIVNDKELEFVELTKKRLADTSLFEDINNSFVE